MYILQGGYSTFFSEHRDRCFPQNYVEMNAKEHEFACEREMGRLKQRTKLSRAQTYAFGTQHMNESPTAPNRYNNDGMMSMISDDQLDSQRVHARRMASY
jgi:M-phase inducer tyrosine phosphatase